MKTHWYTSPDPPKFGEDLKAACGLAIRSAAPSPAVWEEEVIVHCKKCNEAALAGEVMGKYIAVIESGEESIER